MLFVLDSYVTIWTNGGANGRAALLGSNGLNPLLTFFTVSLHRHRASALDDQTTALLLPPTAGSVRFGPSTARKIHCIGSPRVAGT